MGLKSADIFRSPDLLIRHVTCCPGHHELSGIERCRNKTKSFIPVVGLMDIGTLDAYRRTVNGGGTSRELLHPGSLAIQVSDMKTDNVQFCHDQSSRCD